MTSYKNILITGAETDFGKRLTIYFLSQQYFVAVFVTNKHNWELRDRNLEIIEADILDYQSVKAAVSGQQVVVSVFDYKNYKAGEISIILQNILNAITINYVDKYISVVPIGSGQTKNMTSCIFRMITALKYRKLRLKEYSLQAIQLNKTNLDYTIVQVGKINSSENTNDVLKILQPNEIKNKIPINSHSISSALLCKALNIIMKDSFYKSKTIIVSRE
jgi:putative NADH-flavin reductase